MIKHIKSSQDVQDILKKSRFARKETKKLFHTLSRIKPVALDSLFEKTHNEVFKNTDCLVCANCCKTSSPIITNRDIDRISSALRMKAGDFVRDYLKRDEDDDYVFQKTPCSFLGADNTCDIYDVRPKACSEYPHTNRKNMSGIMTLTETNATVCPAVFNILDIINNGLEKRIPTK